MNKIFAYISLGTAIIGLVPTLATQFKNPAALDGPSVWAEIQPILIMLVSATGIHINLQLAQKITLDAVQTIKDVLLKGN